MLEESDEDELDVSGIVRVQSFERLQNQDLSSRDKEDKRSVQSSTSSSGIRGQAVGTTVQPISASKAKVSSVTSSSSQKRREGQELEQDRERGRERDTLSSPAARRDKAVSFEQTSALPASKPLTAQGQGQGQHSPDRKLESGRSDSGKWLP